MVTSPPIIDMHCDLLSHLHLFEGATVHDTEAVGCAWPHLQKGRVRLQVMAAFTMTAQGSVQAGLEMGALYRHLCEGPEFAEWRGESMEEMSEGPIRILYAIENASNIAEEDEPLKKVWERWSGWEEVVARPLYVTLTHHAENRFGGGNLTQVGLKDDGRDLLDRMDRKGIAVDFSHTSDQLARDILNHIDRQGLRIPVLASHSNFREVCDHARNLPEEIAAEIVHRGGLVGINFVRDFIDPHDPATLQKHIQYAWEKGWERHLAFGADFFPPASLPPGYAPPYGFFYPEHQDAGCYPSIVADLNGSPRRTPKALFSK